MAIVKTDMHAYYAQCADQYEAIYDRPERLDDLEVMRERLPEVLLGHEVLEIACGTGYWTELYADYAESVLATDINPEMLRVAKARGLPAGKVEFALMDAYDVQPVRPFTACFAGFWWSHVLREQQIPFLAKLRERLGKDTLVVLIDNAYVEGSSTPIARTDLEGNTFQINKLDNGESYEVLKNFPTDSALRKKISVLAREIKIVRNEHFWMLTCRLK